MERKPLLFIIGGAALALLLLGGVVWWLRQRNLEGLEPLTGSNTVSTSSSIPFVSTSNTAKSVTTQGKVFPSLEDQFKDDQDRDGLKDVEERTLGTDPAKSDTDGDGFKDGEEVHILKLNPLQADPPGASGRPGLATVNTSLPPVRIATTTSVSTSTTPSGTSDQDKDGLTRNQELQLGTDPLKADTDGDGIFDGDEVNKYKTNPLATDTDRDSYPDAIEIEKGYNPLGSGTCAVPTCIP